MQKKKEAGGFPKDSPRIQELKRKARRVSIAEGSFATVQSALGDSYVSPFAIAVNSSNLQIAMLSSFPGLLGPISQWFGSVLMEKYSRKKIVLISVLIHALFWLPMITLAILYWQNIITGAIPILLIVFFSSYIIFGNIAGPAWFSWMGDIVDEKERGRYFAKRNRIAGVVSIVCVIAAAFFLDFIKEHNFLLLGFVLFFFLAMTARLVSRQLFAKQYEPKIKLEKGYYFSFWQFVKKAPFNNFGKFAIFRAFLSFAVAIAGPFFAVYMLRNLNFSYVTFIIVTFSETVFALILMPLWGKFSDKFGNYEVMKITSVLIPAIPLLWLFSKSPYYLIFGPSMVAGISWAGFNLAAGNFIYDSVTPQRRGLVVSYYNILSGIGVFLGAIVGGFLIKYFETAILFMNPILLIFLVSGIIRIFASLILLPRIREVRKVKKFDGTRAFRNLIVKSIIYPIEGTHELFGKKISKKN